MSGAQIDAFAHDIVAHLPGVKAALREEADAIGARAEGLLAAHFKGGGAHVEVTSGRVDSHVALVDPAALSIEYGHAGFTRASDGRHVGPSEGLHILAKAADL